MKLMDGVSESRNQTTSLALPYSNNNKKRKSTEEQGRLLVGYALALVLFFLCCNGVRHNVHVWQSRVEIEGYFVAYFGCITAFEAPYR